MNEFKKNILAVFNSYKCKYPADESKEISILNKNELMGFLRPVTYHYKSLAPEYISLLSRWRRENPIGFPTIFEVTDQRTEFWLENILLKREDRILFVIYSINGAPLGHLGYSNFNFEEKSCEICDVVRGAKTDNKGIMSCAMKSIIQWGIGILKLKNIYLKVLADNAHAIDFYIKNDFIKQFNIPLYKVIQKDETKWVEAKCDEDQKPDRYFIYMKLSESKLAKVSS